MTLILVPSQSFLYRYEGTEGTEDLIGPDDKVIASLEYTDKIKFSTQTMSSDYEIYVLAELDGENIADEKQIWLSIRSSEIPSNFDTYEMYVEDGNGRKASIGITDDELGDSRMIYVSSLVQDKGFNPTFVTRIGVHIKGCKSDITNFTLIFNKFSFTNMPTPHYCQPQDVVNMLGVRNNDGTPFVPTEATNPSYQTIADIICQAENAIEAATRTAWTERRVVGEIRNTGSVSWTGSGGPAYMGIFQPTGMQSPVSSYFRGIAVKLVNSNVKDIDPTKGDKVEVRQYGNNWREVSNFWMDNEKGILYIRDWFFQRDASVRVTYRYGLDEVPEDIKRAAILFSAKHILETSQLYTFMFPESPESFDRYQRTAVSFQYAYDKIIRGRCEQIVVGGV